MAPWQTAPMAICHHDKLPPWHHGKLPPWQPATMAPWQTAPIAICHHDKLPPWHHGKLPPWQPATMTNCHHGKLINVGHQPGSRDMKMSDCPEQRPMEISFAFHSDNKHLAILKKPASMDASSRPPNVRGMRALRAALASASGAGVGSTSFRAPSNSVLELVPAQSEAPPPRSDQSLVEMWDIFEGAQLGEFPCSDAVFAPQGELLATVTYRSVEGTPPTPAPERSVLASALSEVLDASMSTSFPTSEVVSPSPRAPSDQLPSLLSLPDTQDEQTLDPATASTQDPLSQDPPPPTMQDQALSDSASPTPTATDSAVQPSGASTSSPTQAPPGEANGSQDPPTVTDGTQAPPGEADTNQAPPGEANATQDPLKDPPVSQAAPWEGEDGEEEDRVFTPFAGRACQTGPQLRQPRKATLTKAPPPPAITGEMYTRTVPAPASPKVYPPKTVSSILVWNPKEGVMVSELPTQGARGVWRQLKFSEDAAFLCGLDARGKVHLWSMDNGAQIKW
eukprot:gene31395-6558_t